MSYLLETFFSQIVVLKYLSLIIMEIPYNNYDIIIIIIIIMHVYIAPVPGNPVLRRCTIIIIPGSDLFQSNTHISTPRGVYNTCCHYRSRALFRHIHVTIMSCQVLGFFTDE